MRVKKKIIRFISLWLPVILWATMIFKFSAGTVPLASHVYWQDFLVKKTGHVILFSMLAVLIYRALLGYGISRKRAAILAVISAFLYGISDEFHQTFTQGREARLRDTVIDGCGAGIVMFIIYSYIGKLPKKVGKILLEFGIK